ncbi:FecR family protein [Aestuariibaculum sediminum]|uniref:FecR domain-containing protein n=1 Tax=Aestuariibaculum sediminum TaxID=2770637 RepID=A0A8J6Q1Q5_9FLAO|nr:FecR family protein [Aestuariibaculum sediminum]MBD0831235.1 FecR domain-containing protein [Aestuariibaculum sediminum]
MEDFNKDELFLARWIAGELTAEELEKFKNSKDYEIYNKINTATESIKGPQFNKIAVFNKIANRTFNSKDNSKVKSISNWAYIVAATIILAFGIFYFTSKDTQYETGFSEKLAIVLPDQSKVQLNSNSNISFKSRNWKNNRVIQFNGEGFFDVEKGTSFKVITNQGEVEVLGTEFNVITRNMYFEVLCKEGKVRVTRKNTGESKILHPGNAVRIFNDTIETYNFNLKEPLWVEGESSFFNTPIQQVLIALENQYNISFDTSNVDVNKRYTGGFIHDDLKLALRTVLVPMEFGYSLNSEEGKIVLKSK